MYNNREERDYGVTAGHVVAGVVFGAAVGAALGLILAPRTGKEPGACSPSQASACGARRRTRTSRRRPT